MSGRKASTEKFVQTDWKGFLERPLSEDELAQADDWTPDPAEIWEMINALCVEGYSFKLSYSAKLQAATATMVDGIEKSKTQGYALSARDANGALALKLLLYKHAAALDGDWVRLLDGAPRTKRG